MSAVKKPGGTQYLSACVFDGDKVLTPVEIEAHRKRVLATLRMRRAAQLEKKEKATA